MSIVSTPEGISGGKLLTSPSPAVQSPKRPSAPAPQADIGQTEAKPASEAKQLSTEQAVERLQQFVSQSNAKIDFSVDEESGTPVVKVVDSVSKDVIRQIPSEEAINLASALDKLQGLFVRDKA